MALSYNLGYQESILVHPTRRQIFAGKPYSTFPNIWQWVISGAIASCIITIVPSLINPHTNSRAVQLINITITNMMSMNIITSRITSSSSTLTSTSIASVSHDNCPQLDQPSHVQPRCPTCRDSWSKISWVREVKHKINDNYNYEWLLNCKGCEETMKNI